MAAQTQELFSRLKLTHNVTKTSSGSEVHSYTSDLGNDSPILTLIHGYPQSAFEWRYVVPALADKVSLFVPELPGYGISTPQEANSKRAIGSTLLEALATVFNISGQSRRTVILGGHDRGARICHRLSVDKDEFPNLNVVGTVLLDIVPTKVQWDAFANPAIASGYFHWPLLANPEIATNMILAYGGGRWARDANTRIAGNPKGKARVAADGAIEVYERLFDKKETIWYSCLDYQSGAKEDVSQQVEDQQAGRKIAVPLLVMFSKANLGARQDVEKIWEDWIVPGTAYQGIGVGDGYGHYLPEEAHEQVVEAIGAFLTRVL